MAQLAAMQSTMDDERRRFREEAAQQAERIEALEKRLAEAEATNKVRGSRTVVTTTTTTTQSKHLADGAAIATHKAVVTRGSGRFSGKRAAATTGVAPRAAGESSAVPLQPTPAGGGTAAATDSASPAATTAGTLRRTASANNAAAAAVAKKTVPLGGTSTALQHAWDKLCVRARSEFSVKELALMSLDTLKQLTGHYNFRNPIEVAQIEAQWALLQEGSRQVADPTPHNDAPPPRSNEFVPIKVAADFDLRTETKEPRLSHRPQLRSEQPRGANPNDTTSLQRSRSPNSLGAIHVDPVGLSDPNRATDRSTEAARSKKHVARPSDGEVHVFHRGKARSISPNTIHVPARSPFPVQQGHVKHSGVKVVTPPVPDAEKAGGLRTGYPAPAESPDRKSLRRIQQKGSIVLA